MEARADLPHGGLVAQRRYSRPGTKPIDLAVVRDVRRRLADLVRRWPYLRGERGNDNVEGWVSDLSGAFGEQDGEAED